MIAAVALAVGVVLLCGAALVPLLVHHDDQPAAVAPDRPGSDDQWRRWAAAVLAVRRIADAERDAEDDRRRADTP